MVKHDMLLTFKVIWDIFMKSTNENFVCVHRFLFEKGQQQFAILKKNINICHLFCQDVDNQIEMWNYFFFSSQPSGQ